MPGPGRSRRLIMFSLSEGRGCPARSAFSRARGTGKELLPMFRATLFPDLSDFDCLPGIAQEISQRIS